MSSFRLPTGELGDSPAFSFHGTGQRADIKKGLPGKEPTYLKNPGPGAYVGASAFGSQTESQKLSMPRARIGKFGRINENKQYISTAHERALIGVHSPSPNLYSTCTAIGNQVVRLKSVQGIAWTEVNLQAIIQEIIERVWFL